MSSVQSLRKFINERLTAAAEEIWTEFEKTIVHYEGEIDRQRRLLDICLKPKIKLHRTGVQQMLVVNNEAPPEQNAGVDHQKSEPLHVKEEEKELWISLEGERLNVKEESDDSMFPVTAEHMKSEDEEKPLFSQLHQQEDRDVPTSSSANQMTTEAGEGAETTRNPDLNTHEEASISVTLKTKHQDEQVDDRPYIKKPPNAFMLFLREQRPHVVAKDSANVNTILGERWNSLSKEEKEKYYNQADQQRRLHQAQHPNWSPCQNYGKRKKQPKTATSTETLTTQNQTIQKRPRVGADQIQQTLIPTVVKAAPNSLHTPQAHMALIQLHDKSWVFLPIKQLDVSRPLQQQKQPQPPAQLPAQPPAQPPPQPPVQPQGQLPVKPSLLPIVTASFSVSHI